MKNLALLKDIYSNLPKRGKAVALFVAVLLLVALIELLRA
jgi:hypothetical protein